VRFVISDSALLLILLVATLLLSLFWVDRVRAEYFGRNKVQYEDFDFEVLNTEHFRILFYSQETGAVRDAARMLERWYGRLDELFEYKMKQYPPIILYANHADFQQTNVIGRLIPQGTGGVTEALRNRIVIPLTGIYSENNHVLGHELVHAYHYDIMKGEAGLGAGGQIPLWFIEGMAEYLSLGREDPLTAMWMRDAVLHEDVPSLKEVTYDAKYFPYRYGHAIWAYVAGRWGDRVIPQLYHSALKSGWRKAFEKVIGITIDSLSGQWQSSIRQTYGSQINGRTRPADIGTPVITREGGTNLSPVISPDGEYIAYLSRREIFTLDLYLADAHTGEVIKKLVSSNTDAHFDALRFTNSAGCWSPDGAKLAFVVFEDGDNRIAILDVASQKIERTINIDGLNAITYLAWSPDGEVMAVSGTAGGISDLFLYHLKDGGVQRLTDDRYAEIQPTWSPDGSTIAFVTDRGPQTNFNKLIFDHPGIALLDMKTREIQLVRMSPHAKHINPQFSPDGDDLYLVADPDGFSDIYRYSLDKKQFFRITRIATGISGLTELSPAMSMSSKTGRMVFTAFQETGYNVYALESKENEGELFLPNEEDFVNHVSLPPLETSSRGLVQDYMDEPDPAIYPEEAFSRSNYHPSLKLVHIGRTTIGISVDRFGADLGGGTSMLFSDLLGDHMLSVAAQINGGIKDWGGQVLYRNLDKRVNWGVGASHIPYQTARMYSGTDTVTIEGRKYLARKLELVRQRVFQERVSILAEYPFSTNRRLELSTGYTRISYDAEVERLLVDQQGYVISREENSLDAPSALDLSQSSIAYVGDYSFFGFTSPVTGRRYRLELEPTFGSLRYLTVLADYRHYQFWRPVTLAFRMMHYGRYLGDSESDRLSALMLGFETWVRGYSLDSFDPSECTQTGDPDKCPEFDRLVGSRVAVFNAELRLPLFGTDRYGLVNFNLLPVELAAFLDGGVAWTKYEQPTFKLTKRSNQRIPVFSAGLAARFNLLGYLIGQVYYVYPFQRPEKGAHFGFVLAPGW
jgi:Tol biopolymer transport system component